MNDPVTTQSQRTNLPEQFGQKRSADQTSPTGGRWQNLIATNTAIAIGSRIHGTKSEIYVNGMCVQLTGKHTSFPSIVIVNGEPKFGGSESDILQNPTVVVEIVSNISDPAERARKLENYLAIASVKECIFIRAEQMRIEHYSRQNAKQWIYRIYDGRDDVISLESISCKVSVSEIYAQIKVAEASLSSQAVN